MKPRIFITQIPHKRGRISGDMIPSVDISPAAELGEIIEMIPYQEPFFATADLVSKLRHHLRHYDYERGDCLIALGDPAIISAASAILGLDHRNYILLKWDRYISKYLPAHIKV